MFIRNYLFQLSLVLFSGSTAYAIDPQAIEGQLDLRTLDLRQKEIKLSGYWDFYMSRFIDPARFKNDSAYTKDRDFIDFPSTWNSITRSSDGGEGFATYHLKIILASHQFLLALELPEVFSSYKLWINEVPISQNGVVANKKEDAIPQWLPQTITFQPASDTLELVLQISNFHHYKGGAHSPIYLGEAAMMESKAMLTIWSNRILVVCLWLMTLVFLAIYFFSNKGLAFLYFAGMCFTWSIRSVLPPQYLLVRYFPDFPWEFMVRVEYITIYLTMIFGVLFLGRLFKYDVNFLFKYFFVGGNFIFIFTTLLLSVSVFTQLLPIYLSFCILLIVYSLGVVFRALVYERPGVWWMIGSILMGILIFAYDILAYQEVVPYNPLIINGSYLLIFLLNGACLLWIMQFSTKTRKDSSRLNWEDFYQKENE